MRLEASHDRSGPSGTYNRIRGCIRACLIICLPGQINGRQLRRNDRLEPSRAFPDVGKLDCVDSFPLEIVFWRPSQETLTRHRNPLFDREIGITPKQSLVADLLHTFFLGILLVWCRTVIWALIEHGAYGHIGDSHERLVASVLVLRSSLMRFYPVHEKNCQETLTRVADLTVKMLGEPSDRKLKTKGAETWGIALFLNSELQKHHHILPDAEGNRLQHAGIALERVVRIWKGSDWTMPATLQKDSGLCVAPALYVLFFWFPSQEGQGRPGGPMDLEECSGGKGLPLRAL